MLVWTPEEASLRPSLLQRQSTSQGNMGDSAPPDILHDTCACIIHTINLQIMLETLHDQFFSLTSEYSLRDSLTSQPLRTKKNRKGLVTQPYIHVWWPWNAIIQQFVYIPELPELCAHAICNHNANFNLTRAQFRL